MDAENVKTSFSAKWPEDVARRGHAQIPKCLITCIGELGLKPQEAVVLNIIIEKCWKAGDKAWPSVDFIAQAIGRKNSAVRAITKSLEYKGFITKKRQFNAPNLYGLEPTANILAAHMKNCKHTANNPAPYRQKPSGKDGQKSSDYIEAEIIRSINLDPFINSRTSIKNGADDSPLEGEILRNGIGICSSRSGKHTWEDYELAKTNKDGERVPYYYRNCVNCGKQFHSKGKPPWPGYYPPKPNIVVI